MQPLFKATIATRKNTFLNTKEMILRKLTRNANGKQFERYSMCVWGIHDFSAAFKNFKRKIKKINCQQKEQLRANFDKAFP